MKNATMPSWAYGFNKREHGGHEDLQLSPLRWKLVLGVQICGISNDVVGVTSAVWLIADAIYHESRFVFSCSPQLLAISPSTPSAWESTYYCDYMFTMFFLCEAAFARAIQASHYSRTLQLWEECGLGNKLQMLIASLIMWRKAKAILHRIVSIVAA